VITKNQLKIKRAFDVTLVLVLLPLFFVPLIVLIVISSIDTNRYGVFSQMRVGQHGQLFRIYKIRTLREGVHKLGHLEKSATTLGKFLRRTKLDELPQLYNVLIGDMSFVGPRPDLKGFADELVGDDRIILKVKPGITGPATLKYKDEERVLHELNSGLDKTLEVDNENLKSVLTTDLNANKGLYITDNAEALATTNIYIITVPTPTDALNKPVFTPLIKASETVGKFMSKNDIVIYESTVYPGATEDISNHCRYTFSSIN